jgi:serine/threonine protein kinase
MNAPLPVHPTDRTLQSYGLGKLEESQAEAVHAHLEECPECRQRVAGLSSDGFLGRLRDAQNVPSMSGTGESGAGWTLPLPPGKTLFPAPPMALTLPPGLEGHPDYEIKRELGRGGMGVVYLAHNRLMRRDEVLKVMNRELMEQPEILDRFLREIQSVARLRHPNVVTAYSASRIGGNVVFSMEYIEGFDLAKLVNIKGRLPVAHACNFTYQAALGLQHAHEEGMVHRDIKPGNLMLSRRGNRPVVKVLDFGLARATKEASFDRSLTGTRNALGTPAFMAPEQFRDAHQADIRADIYSLGCSLHYLLIGRPPFEGKHVYDLYQAHHSMDVPLLNLLRPEVPVELAALAGKMMAKDPEHRFQTPGEVADALKPLFGKRDARPAAELPLRGASADRPRPIAAGPIASPVPSSSPKQEPAVPDGRWEGLIDTCEQARSEDLAPALPKPRRGRPRWLWSALASAASLAAAILLGVILYVVTDTNIGLQPSPTE